jgi:hypothetical protein
MDSKERWIVTKVDSRDNEVRIYDAIAEKHGLISQYELSFEINKWRELKPIGISTVAVLNVCDGSLGSIWLKRID